MNTLPTERDLPPAARDAARARVVAAATRTPAPPRRWAPVAAAAGLAAVVGGSAVGVAAYRSDPAAAPAASPGPTSTTGATGPGQAGLLARCVRDGTITREARLARDTSPIQLRARWQDGAATVLLIGGTKTVGVCGFDQASRLRGHAASAVSQVGYLDRGPTVLPGMYGGIGLDGLDGDRVAFYSTGWVSRKVARVTVRWADAAPVTAALAGPHFVAAVTVADRPADRWGDQPVEIVAYDAAGNVVGRTN